MIFPKREHLLKTTVFSLQSSVNLLQIVMKISECETFTGNFEVVFSKVSPGCKIINVFLQLTD